MSKRSVTQLPLGVQLRDDVTFESFYPGGNEQLFYTLKKMASGIGDPLVYVWGMQGLGKSHLLQAACHAAVEVGSLAFYFSFHSFHNHNVKVLEGIEHMALICLDDIDAIAGNAEWENALFGAFNAIRDQHARLLVASNVSPKALSMTLPDLQSRLSWGVSYQIKEMSDDNKLKALQLRAFLRGMQLNKTVGRFLLNRCSRNMNELFHTLEILDKATLAQQRALTVPFVKQVLGV